MNIKSLRGTFTHHNAKAVRCWRNCFLRDLPTRKRNAYLKQWNRWQNALMSIADKIITGRIK